MRLGREYGLDGERLKSLEFGSLLHDIGKIGVPDLILRKPAKLTSEEWVLMREHPVHGQQILRGIKFLEGRPGWLRSTTRSGTVLVIRLVYPPMTLISVLVYFRWPMRSMRSQVIAYIVKANPIRRRRRNWMNGPENSLTRKSLRPFTEYRPKIGRELHDQSLMKKEEALEVRRMVEMVLGSQLEAIVS